MLIAGLNIGLSAALLIALGWLLGWGIREDAEHRARTEEDMVFRAGR